MLYCQAMGKRRFLLTVATKLPIAMVGRQTILTTGDILRLELIAIAVVWCKRPSCKIELNGPGAVFNGRRRSLHCFHN